MTRGLALVTPWFGAELTGRAERLAWELARGMAGRGHRVEVLTTCARSYDSDWAAEYFESGVKTEGLLSVRRFKVDPRSIDAFDRANAVLQSASIRSLIPGIAPASSDVCAAFEEHNINSCALVRHIEEHRLDYHAVVFLPYAYGTTLRGIAAARDRAYLQPLLLDEPHAFLPQVEHTAHLARGLLFASEGEAVFGRRLWGPGISEKSRVVGHWIDPAPATNGSRVGNFDAASERYVLYLGRRDETKNIGFAIRAFREYRAMHAVTDLKFVLAGPGGDSFLDAAAGIIDLGLLSEAEQHVLLAHALAIVYPSYNESYARAMWQAWSHGRPVIVNSSCLSAALAVERCDGGWTAGGRSQWVERLRGVDNAHRAFLSRIGQRGYQHYAAHGTIESVFERYETALGLDDCTTVDRGTLYVFPPSPRASNDDARSTAALYASLERGGFELAPLHDDEAVNDHTPIMVDAADESSAAHALAHSGPLLAVFTSPASFTGPLSSRLLDRSAVIAATEHGARSARYVEIIDRIDIVLPLVFDPSRWDVMPDPSVMAALADGVPTILCVGPLSEGSGAADAIATFSFLIAMECDARLVLVNDHALDADTAEFADFLETYGLAQRVTIESTTSPQRLAAYYRSASLFLSLSERDDTLAAFVDSMLFDVPILAFGTRRVRELLGPAGIIVSRVDPALLGALAKEMLRDESLRSAVIAAQHSRRVGFDGRILDPYVAQFANGLRLHTADETA